MKSLSIALLISLVLLSGCRDKRVKGKLKLLKSHHICFEAPDGDWWAYSLESPDLKSIPRGGSWAKTDRPQEPEVEAEEEASLEESDSGQIEGSDIDAGGDSGDAGDGGGDGGGGDGGD